MATNIGLGTHLPEGRERHCSGNNRAPVLHIGKFCLLLKLDEQYAARTVLKHAVSRFVCTRLGEVRYN
jgi:hypothetical protein